MSICHVVLFRLVADDLNQREADGRYCQAELLTLRGQIPGLLSLQVERNILHPGENWDLLLCAEFADTESLTGYGPHPAHQEVIGRTNHLMLDRASIDYSR